MVNKNIYLIVGDDAISKLNFFKRIERRYLNKDRGSLYLKRLFAQEIEPRDFCETLFLNTQESSLIIIHNAQILDPRNQEIFKRWYKTMNDKIVIFDYDFEPGEREDSFYPFLKKISIFSKVHTIWNLTTKDLMKSIRKKDLVRSLEIMDNLYYHTADPRSFPLEILNELIKEPFYSYFQGRKVKNTDFLYKMDKILKEGLSSREILDYFIVDFFQRF